MNNKQQYVLGFIFDSKLEKVLLTKKIKGPKGVKMRGLNNGVGGKIKKNEGIFDAMERECKEETGLDIMFDEWVGFCSLYLKHGMVYCLYAVTDEIYNFKQMEDEELNIYLLDSSEPYTKNGYLHYKYNKRMANLDWLIPMALNHYKKLDSAQYFEIIEKKL